MAINKLSTTASLKDVMDKFEEISFQNLSNIDIVVSSSLPDEVVNDRLVIITDSVNNIRIGKKTTLAENDIFIPVNSEDAIVSYDIKAKNKSISIEIYEAYKVVNGVETMIPMYLGKDGEWIKTTVETKYLFKAGEGLHSSVGEITSKADDSEGVWSGYTTITNDYIKFETKDLTDTTYQWKTTKEIDFTYHKNLVIDCLVKERQLKVIIGDTEYSVTKNNTNRQTAELDISNIKGKHILKFRINENMYKATTTIYNMMLTGGKI